MSVLLNSFLNNNFMGGVAGTPGEPTSDPTSGYVPIPAQQIVSPEVAEFYGGILNIAQPDASYFEEFPLPGVSGAGGSGTGLNVSDPSEVVDTRIDYTDPAIYEPAVQILQQALQGGADPVAVNEAMNDLVSGGTSEMGMYQPPMTGLMDMQSFIYDRDPLIPQYDDTVLRDQMFELQNRIDQLEIPDFRQFDPSGLQAQINELATAQPMDTSQFLTAADLPTFQQFDPTALQTQIDQLAMAQPMDTSQFLTAADLPTYDTTALEQDIAELREQLNSNTAFSSTAGLTTPTFQGILPDFGGFNVR